MMKQISEDHFCVLEETNIFDYMPPIFKLGLNVSSNSFRYILKDKKEVGLHRLLFSSCSNPPIEVSFNVGYYSILFLTSLYLLHVDFNYIIYPTVARS